MKGDDIDILLCDDFITIIARISCYDEKTSGVKSPTPAQHESGQLVASASDVITTSKTALSETSTRNTVRSREVNGDNLQVRPANSFTRPRVRLNTDLVITSFSKGRPACRGSARILKEGEAAAALMTFFERSFRKIYPSTDSQKENCTYLSSLTARRLVRAPKRKNNVINKK
ncbi:hypothetical protein EVAR_36739_1 [Eumeta japonica]|uniref:Uncharacterized protein n=1 Tax=Eumeta variegata TaxID=151549 RepID=A0A4C1X278_EUMVA|nr:hypothetical protein EVAR_36739_1 [Eumeta japonica]